MRSRTRTSSLPAAALRALGAACSEPRAAARAASEAPPDGVGSRVADRRLAPYQDELIEVAFEAVTAMPLDPHVKPRSSAQEAVAGTCFELDQPRRALGYVEQIENWRRGLGYAEFALYCAEHGDTSEVQDYLDRALEIAERYAQEEAYQQWRIARILAKIAETHIVLGDYEKAAKFEPGVVDSQAGELLAARAKRLDVEALDAQIPHLDEVVLKGNFDQIKNALGTCALLFDRFYDDVERRSLLEEKLRAVGKKMPSQIFIEHMMELAETSISHDDPDKAFELLSEAQSTAEGFAWSTRHRVPILARLAALRHRAGDEERARRDVDAVLATYDAERDGMVDIDRAGTLRPLAEAYRSIGDTETARVVYGRALEEGGVNPNSKPRAEDLSATLCSMARSEVEPDEAMWVRIREIREDLDHPW